MRAVILAMGDELTSGQRVDTNSAWLSRQLADLGIGVLFHGTAGDELEATVELFRWAMRRCELVISSGGLGPTADDLVRDALAIATGCELVLDEPSRERIQALFAARGRTMPPQNERQAFFPRGSRVLPNPHGTAPGIDWAPCNSDLARVVALPGVPAEMREMWQQTVGPSLLAAKRSGVIRHRQIKCFGLGESEVEQRLPGLIQRGREPRVGITAHRATITLRVTAEGLDEASCWSAMQPTIDSIHACLGDHVFGVDDEELPEVVLNLLARRGQTLATAENATLGWLAQELAAADGGRGCFLSGLVLGPTAGGSDASGVSAAAPGAALATSLRDGARQLRRTWACDYALVVGAVQRQASLAEPPWVPIELHGPEGEFSQRSAFVGHPDIVVERCAKVALDLLRRHLSALAS